MRREITKLCKNCESPYPTRDPRSLFCSRSCAGTFNSSRPRTEETKRRTSEALKKAWREHPRKEERSAAVAGFGAASQVGRHKTAPESILDLSSRTVSKICKRLRLSCSRCGWSETSCDLHHIVPRKRGGTDEHNNLSHLCPNCHRLVHEGKVLATELVSFDAQVGDRWKEYYLG